jgi:hypothetical protein
LKDPGVHERIILKWILRKWDGAWTGLIWLRRGTGGVGQPRYWEHENARGTVPSLRRSVAGLAPRRSGLNPRGVHVGFMLDSVALRQVFFFRSIIIMLP